MPTKKYFDLYDFEDVQLPEYPPAHRPEIPTASRDYLSTNYNVELEKLRIFAHTSLVTISFMDARVDRLLDALGRLGLTDNTIVVFLDYTKLPGFSD